MLDTTTEETNTDFNTEEQRTETAANLPPNEASAAAQAAQRSTSRRNKNKGQDAPASVTNLILFADGKYKEVSDSELQTEAKKLIGVPGVRIITNASVLIPELNLRPA